MGLSDSNLMLNLQRKTLILILINTEQFQGYTHFDVSDCGNHEPLLFNILFGVGNEIIGLVGDVRMDVLVTLSRTLI